MNTHQQPFTLDDGPTTATRFRCALCGVEFTHGGRACDSCPLIAACDLVSCPRCGHSFPRRSTVADLLRHWMGRRRKAR